MLSKHFLLPKSPMRRKQPTITITQIRWYDQFFSIEMSGNKKRLPDLPGFNHPTIYRLTDCHHRWAKFYRLQTPSRIRPHNVGNRFLLPNILMRRKRFAITITQIRWYHQLFSIEMSGNKKRLPDLPGYPSYGFRV